MRGRTRNRKNRASALIVAMIAIGVLTIVAASSLQRSTVDTNLAGRWGKRALASEVAETGLNRVARQVLDQYRSSESINSLLGRYVPGTSGGGTYLVQVLDNSSVGGVDQDGDGSATTDSDRIFVLRSIGSAGQSDQLLEAFYRINTTSSAVEWPPAPTGCPSPPCNSAVLLCGSSEVARGGSSDLDGSDYPYPEYGCTGSHCNVSAISGTTGNYDVIGDSAVSVSGSGVTSLPNLGANAGCSAWQSFYDQWVNVSPTATGVVHITGSSYSTSNDCDHPKIFLVDTAHATLTLASNSYMCGTFIFKSNTALRTTGTITLVGVVLMMGNYTTNALSPSTGTSNVLGKVILRSTISDSQTEIGMTGNGEILYSSAGMNAGLQALNDTDSGASGGSASLGLVSWRTLSR